MQVQTKVMNNYMGIGVDAKVSLEFDRLRTKFPHWFKSQMGEWSCLTPNTLAPHAPAFQDNTTLVAESPQYCLLYVPALHSMVLSMLVF